MTSGQLLTLFLAMSQRLHLHGHVTILAKLLFSYVQVQGPGSSSKKRQTCITPVVPNSLSCNLLLYFVWACDYQIE